MYLGFDLHHYFQVLRASCEDGPSEGCAVVGPGGHADVRQVAHRAVQPDEGLHHPGAKTGQARIADLHLGSVYRVTNQFIRGISGVTRLGNFCVVTGT